jgi:hypothetical protein
MARTRNDGIVNPRFAAPKIIFNACVRNVSAMIQTCDKRRVVVHLPNDRAAITPAANKYFLYAVGA